MLAAPGSAISEVILLRLLIRHAEKNQRRRAIVLPVPFHRRDLGGLVLERVEPVLVAEEELKRRQDRDHSQPHPHHRLRLGLEADRRAGSGRPRPGRRPRSWR